MCMVQISPSSCVNMVNVVTCTVGDLVNLFVNHSVDLFLAKPKHIYSHSNKLVNMTRLSTHAIITVNFNI